jgi:hypothetical protein
LSGAIVELLHNPTPAFTSVSKCHCLSELTASKRNHSGLRHSVRAGHDREAVSEPADKESAAVGAH